MKRIVLAVIFGVASLSSISTKAQVSVNINIGSQPQWGPTGYNHVDYYYLPDLDVYYYVPTAQYIYASNGSWVWRNSLPAKYSGYDLYNSYKVVMNTKRPYLSHQSHVQQYGKYKNYNGKQPNIRNSKDTRYANARNTRTVTNRPTTNRTVKTVSRNNGSKKTVTRSNTMVRNQATPKNQSPGRGNKNANTNGNNKPGNDRSNRGN